MVFALSKMPVLSFVFVDVVVGVGGDPMLIPPTTINPLFKPLTFSTDSLIELGLLPIWSLVIPVRRVVVPVPGETGVPENTSIDLPAAAVRVTAESSRVKLVAASSSALRS